MGIAGLKMFHSWRVLQRSTLLVIDIGSRDGLTGVGHVLPIGLAKIMSVTAAKGIHRCISGATHARSPEWFYGRLRPAL